VPDPQIDLSEFRLTGGAVMPSGECEGAFRLLDQRICRELVKLGLVRPTEIQEKAIPVIIEGRDTLVVAPTGSGKTEAALLPLFHKLLKEKDASKSSVPKLVYITPLRALNRDIFIRMERLSLNVGLTPIVRHGDSSLRERREFLSGNVDWFVTTPESFVMMLSHEKTRARLGGIEYVVIDEIHELIDSERGSELEVALRRLKRLTGSYQLVGLSATLSDYELAKKYYPFKRNCAVVKLESLKDTEIYVDSSGSEGFFDVKKHFEWVGSKIAELKRTFKSAIIFVNTRNAAEFLGFHLKNLGFLDILVHHGSLSLEVRKEVEANLKRGEIWGVIATSSLELGIDVGHLDLVIQYGSPRQAVRLAQRAGRSGHRLTAKSRAVILAEPLLDDIVESAVIARRTLANLMESLKPHENPLDVLLHQLVGIVLANEAKTPEEAFEILRGSSTFRSLDWATFNELLEYALETNLLRSVGGELSPGKRARSYFFSVNMIPDTKRVPVYATYGERIGFLDEDFVLAKLSKGASFILAGKEWEVVEVGEDRVVVKPAEAKVGVPPAWEGELIPVDYKVAREECALLHRAHSGDITGTLRDYPFLEERPAEFLKRVTEEARSKGYLPPSPAYVLIESDESDRLAVVYSCLGSKGNDALAILLGHYVETRLGYKASYSSDPLRVFIELARPGAASLVQKVLAEVSANAEALLQNELESAVKSTSLFYWKLSQVAKKMGMISPDANLKEAARLVKYLADTVAGREALRELLAEKLDLKLVKEFLEEVRSGKKRVVRQHRSGLSPYTFYGGRASMTRRIQSEGLPAEVAVKMLEKRVMEKDVVLICLNCGHQTSRVVGALPDDIKCEKCGARLLAPVPPAFAEMEEAIKKYVKTGRNERALTERERELLKEAVERAELVLTHGKKAVIALSVQGVGPRAAKRALSALKFGWEEFLRALYEEQLNWFRTREYWDK